MAIVGVRINGEVREAPRPLLRRGAQFFVTSLDLRDWNLVIPREPSIRVEGTDWYDLHTLAGARLSFDEGAQSVDLQVAPEAFLASVGAARGSERPPITPSVLAAFVNYDLVLQNDNDGTRLSGLIDATASSEWGTLGTNVLAGQAALGGQRTTRLDSYFSRDDPDRLRRLTVGDAITQAAPWSSPVRFGGIQFGTRFGLQPGFVTYPLPTLHGGSAVPSTVQVFVDNVLRYQQPVAAGPFAIENVPVLSGAGQMRFGVTDALGVQRYVNLPYYVSSNLLRDGLSDYSVEAGWTRRGYGERSFDYDTPFVSGLWRYGLTNAVTVDVRGEYGAKSRTAGTGATWVWAAVGEFSLHGAVSSGRSEPSDGASGVVSTTPAPDVPGRGHLMRASYTRSGTDWNFSAVRQQASRGFTEVGWQDDFSHLNSQSQFFVGRTLGRYGTLGGSYTKLGYSSGDRVTVGSLNWSIPIGTQAVFGTYLTRSRQNTGVSATSVGITFTMALGQNRSTSVSAQRSTGGRPAAQAEYSQLPPGDLGVGYRLSATQGDAGHRFEGGADWRTRWAVLSADVATLGGQTATRLQANGSVGVADGFLFATRASSEAFALVTVEGAPGITLYRENQPWVVTDKSGRAIIPNLRAYGTNHLSIEPGDLPIEVTLRRDNVIVVPRYKSVAAVNFDLSNDVVVNATVLLPDGEPLPPGVEVVRTQRSESLVAGFNGAVSIAAPVEGEVLEARWGPRRCSFALGKIDLARKLPTLGPYTCAPLPLAPSSPSGVSP